MVLHKAILTVNKVCICLHRKLSQLRPENIFGFLVNIPSRMSVPLPFHGKHWIAIRRVGDTYYELDSKHSKPLAIGKTDSELLQFLATRLKSDSAKTADKIELLLVLSVEVSRSGSWKEDSDSSAAEQRESS